MTMPPERLWTGVLWEPGVSVDRRRILRSALHVGEEWPPLVHPVRGTVGVVVHVAELGGYGVAAGFAYLDAGDYPVAMTVDEALFIESYEDDGGLVLAQGRLASVSLCAEPAWPGATITVRR